MNKKGFTLIELLAVIVILAIIALIATPIVLDIINDTKESASLRSAEFYMDAVEQAIAQKMINDPTFKAKECRIEENGKLLCSELGFNICEKRDTEIICGSDSKYVKEVQVNVSGEKPTEGLLKLNNGQIEDAQLTLNNTSTIIKENNLVNKEDNEIIYEANHLSYCSVEKMAFVDINELEHELEKNVIYKGTFSFQGFELSGRAILYEEDGMKILKTESIGGLPIVDASDFQGVTKEEGYIKIEKTNEKLGDYSLRITPSHLYFYSNEFQKGLVKFYVVLEEGSFEITYGNDQPEFTLQFGDYVDECIMIGEGLYEELKAGRYFYIRVEQEIDGKKIIRQYGGTKPKYQETHVYEDVSDSYYWGNDFYPGFRE